jgi:hypothetical protein
VTARRAARPVSSAEGSACRTVRVCGRGIFKRVASADADRLITRGWGVWVSDGRTRHVELTQAAPISSLRSDSERSMDSTRPVIADRSCRVYSRGQLMGDPRFLREFRPLPQQKK